MIDRSTAIRALLREGRAQLAIAQCAEALAADPASAEMLFLLGLAFQQAGDPHRAIESLDRAIALDPSRIEAIGTVANLHSAHQRPDLAIARLEQARMLDPRHPSVRFNLGNALLAIGRSQEAAGEYEMAIHLKPDHAGAWHQLAVTKLALERAEDALICVHRALSMKDDTADYRLTEAACFRSLGQWAAAITSYRSIAERFPQDWRPHIGLAGCLTNIGAADQSEPFYLEALRLAPSQAALIWSSYLMSLQYRSDVSAERLTAAHRAFQTHQPARPRARKARADGPLRVGFVSGDFCGHPVGHFALPVLTGLDRNQFTVFAYSATPARDAVTEQLRQASDHWREIRGMPASAIATQVDQDRIDILIDLSGHTGNRRLDLFALRPARTQIGWLGYPGPYAWPGIDWRISDSIMDPVAEDGFGDAVIRLDRTPLCYSPSPERPIPPRERTERRVFGSFNNLAKLDPATLSFWADLLSAFPTAILKLKGKGADDAAVTARLDTAFAKVRDRVGVTGWATSQTDHLAQYDEIDVALDPLPYNGATTTCEALTCGTPVLSRHGDRPAARMGNSLLTNANLSDWVQPDRASAISFLRANHPDPHRIRSAMATSGLCDPSGFVARFGDALISSMSEPPVTD